MFSCIDDFLLTSICRICLLFWWFSISICDSVTQNWGFAHFVYLLWTISSCIIKIVVVRSIKRFKLIFIFIEPRIRQLAYIEFMLSKQKYITSQESTNWNKNKWKYLPYTNGGHWRLFYVWHIWYENVCICYLMSIIDGRWIIVNFENYFIHSWTSTAVLFVWSV